MQRIFPTLKDERVDVEKQVQELHLIYARIGAYGQTRKVSFSWTEELSSGPKLLRSLFRRRRALVGPYRVCVLGNDDNITNPAILMVSDDTEGDPPVGAVALYNEKTKEYVAFDFERGNSVDFHIVKKAVAAASTDARNTWKTAPKIYSSREWEERAEQKKLHDDHNTPH